MPTKDDYEFVHISSAATTVVVGAACKLKRLTVNTTTTGLIIMYNSATSLGCLTTNAVGTLPASATVGTYDYEIKLGSGLVIVTLAASDITAVYATA